ncbi:hypothetical protein [Thermogymnomonas acidicola]|uniref:hypothetical protein n=1 Tax=Thermogymnomonas acidicola TaxID=399579 RepID=UPI0009465B53|nr:hypothetical protein [Thermogymnomonas acidicola]
MCVASTQTGGEFRTVAVVEEGIDMVSFGNTETIISPLLWEDEEQIARYLQGKALFHATSEDEAAALARRMGGCSYLRYSGGEGRWKVSHYLLSRGGDGAWGGH